MLERSRALTSAALCALLLASAPAFGSDATGLIHFASCDRPYNYRLELTTFGRKRLEKPIAFRILGDLGLQMFANQWIDIPGVECATPGHCENAAFCKIQVVHISCHWWRTMRLSGNFIIRFADGRKLEGSFTAKYVKPPHQIICE